MKTLFLTTAGLLMVLVAGCAQSPEVTDQEWISDLVSSSDLALTSNLDGTGDPSDGKAGEEVNMPEVWYRQLLSEPSPELIIEGDPSAGVCTVTVVHEITAELIIDTVHDGIFQPGTKPIQDTRYIRLALEKDEDLEEHGGWRIVSATPAQHMTASGEQEVFINSMALYEGDELLWECTNPDTFYDVDSEHPVLEEGTLVRMEATVDHLNPLYEPAFFVVAHGPLPGHSRHMMNDNGLFGDHEANDGVFSYQWYVEYTCPRQRIAVDVIDADTFEDQTEDDYDAGAWGIRFLKE